MKKLILFGLFFLFTLINFSVPEDVLANSYSKNQEIQAKYSQQLSDFLENKLSSFEKLEEKNNFLSSLNKKIQNVQSRSIVEQNQLLKSILDNFNLLIEIKLDELIKQERSAKEESKLYQVTDVIDGDTVKIEYENDLQNVRLIGIDAPESTKYRLGHVQCYGEKSTEYLRKLIDGEKVRLEFDETQGKYDKYNRLLAYLWYNKENINQKMLEGGYGWEYTYNSPYKYRQDFQDAEISAKRNNKGLWDSKTCDGEQKKEVELQELEESTFEKQMSQEIKETDDIRDTEVDQTDNKCIDAPYCYELSSCSKAYFYLKECGLDRLDGDSDGVPCESLCN